MILEKLAEHAAKRVEAAKARVSLPDIKDTALALPRGAFTFETALRREGLSFICEVKRASPSKGLIAPEFPYIQIAREYEAAGADCVSCLTEPKWFLGSDKIFSDIRKNIAIPMLRKDFTVDEYQLYEAKCLGADAVLLICSLLSTGTIAKYLEICDDLGLSAVVEAHNVQEIGSAVSAGAKIIGVNNRNLKDFSVDIGNAARLRALVPDKTLFIAESGIQDTDDVAALCAYRVDAVLIGETMMRACDKKALLSSFREASR
ncbi:MAG: indole-3-glycerol phosphate synthase TrpC [Oscillospiraceae bacterium]